MHEVTQRTLRRALSRFLIVRYYRKHISRAVVEVTVDDGRPNIAISWETRSLAGVVARMDRPRYIVRADAVGVGEDGDVTAEPLHERVPGVPLASNWNWSLHWINSLRGYRRNFTSTDIPAYRHLRSWYPVPSRSLSSSPRRRPRSPEGPAATEWINGNAVTLTRLLWKSAYSGRISVESFRFYFVPRERDAFLILTRGALTFLILTKNPREMREISLKYTRVANLLKSIKLCI